MPVPNPPIPGHHLISEGHILPIWSEEGWTRDVVSHTGGCQCGAKPPGFPNLSARKVKDWHRVHKDEIRSQALLDQADLDARTTGLLNEDRGDTPRLGLATTQQLLEELEARFRTSGYESFAKSISDILLLGSEQMLEYRTVDDV